MCFEFCFFFVGDIICGVGLSLLAEVIGLWAQLQEGSVSLSFCWN